MKRIAVVGSREYPRLTDVDECVDAFSAGAVVVSGGALGVDSRARERARMRGLAYDEFLPDWEGLGRRAGIERNERMLATVTEVFAFWDGSSRGTKHAIEFAQSKNILVHVRVWEPHVADLRCLVDELRKMHEVAAQHGYTLPAPVLRTLRWWVAEVSRRA